MQPKAEYFDELVDRNLLTSFRETAKQLGIGEKAFIAFLLEKSTSTKTKGKLMPSRREEQRPFSRSRSVSTRKLSGAALRPSSPPKAVRLFRLLYLKVLS